MTIYIDLLFILNFLFDLLLLLALGIILKRKTTLKRLLLSVGFSTISMLIFFIISNIVIVIFTKIIISIIMVIICYGYKDLVYTTRNVFYLYTISIFLGGFLYLVNTSITYKNNQLLFYNSGLKINFLFLLVLSPIVIYLYVKEVNKLRNNYNNYYNINLYLSSEECLSLTGFLDSGNNLYDPYKKRPIILVNKDLIKIDYSSANLILVPYYGLNSSGLLKCLIPKKIYINDVGERKNFLIGLSDEKIKLDGVDCILHKELL